MAGRRDLSFDRLDDVMPEVDRLLSGHTRAGSWTLGQVLHHLASAIRLTMAPPTPFVEGGPRADREAEVARRRFFRAGRFPDGVQVPHPSLLPPVEADERVQAESLRSAFRGFADHDGPLPAHPLLGPLSRDEWDAFHRLHCAHHLGLVRPDPAGCTPPPDSGGPIEGGSR